MIDDYQKGFKDGFAAGLEEGKKLAPKQPRLDDYVFCQSGYLEHRTHVMCVVDCRVAFKNTSALAQDAHIRQHHLQKTHLTRLG
jgi:hypothetical protein